MSSNSWIFVVGAPRSGTSLLRRLLSCHGRLYISPELRILELIKIAGSLAAPADPRRQVVLGRSFGRLLAHRQLAATGSARYGDKYPPYCADMDELSALFPDARFVHIIRDGRDVVSSLARTRAANRGWRRGTDIPPTRSLVEDWASFVLAARRSGARLPGRYHELRYESLLAEPIATLEGVLSFLGEAKDPEMWAGLTEIRPGRSWRRTLSPGERQCFIDCVPAETLLQRLGYGPTPPPEGPVRESAADWAARAEDGRAGVPALTRAIRGEEVVRDAALRLLAMPEVPESVFAALNLLDDPDAGAALSDWAVGRGLDATAAAALFAPDVAEEAA